MFLYFKTSIYGGQSLPAFKFSGLAHIMPVELL
jgi:hypothetical protein